MSAVSAGWDRVKLQEGSNLEVLSPRQQGGDKAEDTKLAAFSGRDNIVRILGTFEDEVLRDGSPLDKEYPAGSEFISRKTFFVVMPFFGGGTLKQLLKALPAGVAIPEAVVASYLCQLLDSVVQLNKAGVAHRDLKLDNLFLTGPQQRQLALADFGTKRTAIFYELRLFSENL